MSHISPTEDERICAWFECQSEDTLRDLHDRFDAVSPRECWNAFFNDHVSIWYESLPEEIFRDLCARFGPQTPRQAWHAYFTDCPPPALQSPGESLAVPAAVVQGVDTPTLEQFQRWLETRAHQAHHDYGPDVADDRIERCRAALWLLMEFKDQA